MSDDIPEKSDTAPRVSRRRSRRILLAPLWMASVLVFSLAIAGLGAYLAMRQPDVVERILPPPAQSEHTAEATRRAEALRALNDGLRVQIEALRRELEQTPQCPPGTALDPAAGERKSMLPPRDGLPNPGRPEPSLPSSTRHFLVPPLTPETDRTR